MPTERTEPSSTRTWNVLGLALLVLSGTFMSSWWLIGDLSFEGPVEGGLDYMYRAPNVSATTTTVGGIGGLGVAAVSASILGAHRRARLPAAVLVAGGAFAALIARTVTAGVIGANIGGGIAMLFLLPPLVIAMIFTVATLPRRMAQTR